MVIITFLVCIFVLPFVFRWFTYKEYDSYKETGTNFLIPINKDEPRRPYYKPEYDDNGNYLGYERCHIMISYNDYDDNTNVFRVVPAWHKGKEIQTIQDDTFSPEEVCRIFKIDPLFKLVDKFEATACTGHRYTEFTWRKDEQV